MEFLNLQELYLRLMQHLCVSVGMWALVIVAILLDLWDGVYTAKKLQQPIRSRKLRITCNKISEYWRVILIGFIIDTILLLLPIWGLPYMSMIVCVILVIIEGKSMFEHAKRRKSRVTELKDIIKMAVDCASEADAKDMLKRFGEYLENAKDATKFSKETV